MDQESKLHVVMLPWLAMGHIIPFLELSKCLVQKGHHVSFLSTPRNLQRLPNIPTNLCSLISLVEVSLPQVEGLQENAEATIDLPPNKVHYLKKAFDGLKYFLPVVLEDLSPDWIIYDFASYWLPPIAAKLGIPCAFFSLFNASAVSFFGPPSRLMSGDRGDWTTSEDLCIIPKWMNFTTNVGLRMYEVLRVSDTMKENVAEVEDGYRFGAAVDASQVVFIRSCMEFEKFWLKFLEDEILLKPVIPVGLLPPTAQEEVTDWTETKEWLDNKTTASVVYVALGTEATVTQDEVNELALGLEHSELPFFWVLRKPSSTGKTDSYALPEGFEDRIKGRGVVCKGWAPQVKILAHPSVGGFLTHCGWNSIIESLSFGCALILLPLIAEQGLNARVLHGDKIAMEIPRDKHDGSFTKESIAATLRTVMVDEEGEIFRKKAKEMKEIFGDKDLHDLYVEKFIGYLQDHKLHPGNQIL